MQQKLEKNSDFFIQEEKVLFLTRESLEKIIEQLLIDHLNNIKTICCIDTDQERLTLLQLFMASEIRQKYPYTGFWLQKKAEEPWHYEQAHYQFLQLILTQQWPTHKKNSLLKNKKNTLAVSTKSKENKRKEKSLKLA